MLNNGFYLILRFLYKVDFNGRNETKKMVTLIGVIIIESYTKARLN